MADDNKVKLILELDGDDAKSALKQFVQAAGEATDKVKSQTSKAKEATSQWGDSFRQIGAIVGGLQINTLIEKAKDVVVETYHEMINEAAKAEKAITLMNFALAASGSLSKESSASFHALADQIQKTTTFTDDAAVASITLSKNLGLTNDQTVKVLKAATELAAATGTDLTYAVQTLSLTYDGQLGRLGKLIPALRGLSEEQLRAGEGVEFVANRFKGAGEVIANTYEGSLIRQKNAYDDLLKALGSIVTNNPYVIEANKKLTKVYEDLANWVKENKQLLLEISVIIRGALVGAVGILIVGLGTLGQALTLNLKAFRFLQDAVFETIGFFLQFDLVQKAIKAVSLAIVDLIDDFIGILDLATKIPGVSLAFDKLGIDIKNVVATFKLMSKESKESIKAANPKEIFEEFNKGRKVMTDTVINGLDTASNKAVEFGKNMLNSGKTMIEAAVEGSVQFSNLSESLKNTGDNIKVLPEYLAKFFAELRKDLDKSTLLNVEAVKDEYLLRIKYLDEIDKLGRDTSFERHLLDMKYLADKHAAELKDEAELASLEKERLENVKKYIDNPFLRRPGTAVGRSGLTRNQEQIGGQIGGIGLAVLSGREGALKLLSQAASTFATAAFGPLGQLAGPLLEKLAQGPEKVKEMVQQFAEAVPDIIVAVTDALPAVIEALGDKLSDPAFLEKLARAMIHGMTAGADRFVQKALEGALRFVAKIFEGAGQFISKLLDGAAQFIEKLIDGIGEGLAKIFEKLNPAGGNFLGSGAGLPNGRGLIPGLGNGRGGVTVAPGISIGGGGGGSGVDVGPVHIGFKGESQNIQPIVLQIGNRQLAEVMVEMDRLGFRRSVAGGGVF